MTLTPHANKTSADFGSWKSPISTDLIVADSIRIGQLKIHGADIYWTEGRPKEEGRDVLVRHSANSGNTDISKAPYSVRSRANEYGGGSFLLHDGTVFFSNNEDQRIYILKSDGSTTPLTAGGNFRYADAIADPLRNRLISVREDHTDSTQEAINSIIAINLTDGRETVLLSGSDFYSSPCLSPDGKKLAWLSWNHPNMPWDGTTLWQVEIDTNGFPGNVVKIAGGDAESIFQPSWSGVGILHFVADTSGWWNLYRHKDGQIEALYPMAAEFGQAQWIFGMSTYGFDQEGRIVCTYLQNGTAHLAISDTGNKKWEEIATPFQAINHLRVGADFVAFTGGAPTIPESVVRLDLQTRQWEILRRSNNLTIDAADLSIPEAITFPTEDGLSAHAFYYAPNNQHFQGPESKLPPLLLFNHGGPTAMTTASLNLSIQFWTSRGFAVADVNYGGSSGFGRPYRQRLNGQWGVVDVNDAVNAARFLIERGDINPKQLAIRGGSAGGYTALCALTFRNFFTAGASYYGVGDLMLLAQDTHKFESRYLDKLVGPYPEQKQLYFDRSPINFTEQLASPLILFQGLKDKVVPPNQAQTMFDAVRTKGLPVAYITFEQEQHGFRRAENIKRALDAELYFYAKIFGFTQADDIEPVDIQNMDKPT